LSSPWDDKARIQQALQGMHDRELTMFSGMIAIITCAMQQIIVCFVPAGQSSRIFRHAVSIVCMTQLT
jgi:hypothetical protein